MWKLDINHVTNLVTPSETSRARWLSVAVLERTTMNKTWRSCNTNPLSSPIFYGHD